MEEIVQNQIASSSEGNAPVEVFGGQSTGEWKNNRQVPAEQIINEQGRFIAVFGLVGDIKFVAILCWIFFAIYIFFSATFDSVYSFLVQKTSQQFGQAILFVDFTGFLVCGLLQLVATIARFKNLGKKEKIFAIITAIILFTAAASLLI